MGPPAIDDTLLAAEASVAKGRGLGGTGFWSAVAEVKRRPELVDTYGERIAVLDRDAFLDWALVAVPVAAGTILMVLATLVGVAIVGAAYFVDAELVRVLVFYVGLGVLLVTTHGLTHLVVGRAVDIRFTHWFIGTVKRPQPGVKTDYASYLRTDPKSRAWMHASGAIVTKVIPFALIGAAVAADLPGWAVWGLIVIGLGSILTDVIWSASASDWKKFNRERAFAHEAGSERGIDPSR